MIDAGCTVLILINVSAVINTPCPFSKNNVILTCVNSWLLVGMRYLFEMGYTLKGKNLFLEEQILFFKS